MLLAPGTRLLAAALLVALPQLTTSTGHTLPPVQRPTATAATPAGSAGTLNLMPMPRTLALHGGRFALDSTLRVAMLGKGDARLGPAVQRFLDRLEPRLATPLSRRTLTAVANDTRDPLLIIEVVAPGERVQSVREDESYTLAIDSTRAVLHANTTVGAMHGLETLLQLVSGDAAGYYFPTLRIDDAPRFPWRGLLVDVSRHFEPVSEVERTLDGMAAVKLNVLHWHLSDDQGVRVESRLYPRLQRVASDGQYYTQAQIREVVAYARDRGIRVVPEFDMPGHSLAFITAYPWLASSAPTAKSVVDSAGHYTLLEKFGGSDAVMDPTRASTYQFIDRFMGEMTALFPDQYWHVGGDEVVGKQWNETPRIVRFKARHHLADNNALQAYFNQRLSRIVTQHGRRMIGWDEVLHPGLPTGTMVQSWRGTKYLGQATAAGFPSILSAPYYLDAMKPADVVYQADPLPDSLALTPAQDSLVLGGEATMWAELVGPGTIDSRVWPRLAAIAERFWSPASVRDVNDMYRRLDFVQTELENVGIDLGMPHAHRFARRMTGSMTSPALDTLLRYAEPVNLGQRLRGTPMTRATPLVHVVDAAVPDPAGRHAFALLVDRYLADSARGGNPVAGAELAAVFRSWSLLPAAIASDAATTPTVREALPAADALARVAGIGEQATHGTPNGDPLPPDWRAASLAALDSADKPRGVLHLTVIAPLRLLVQQQAAMRTAPPAATPAKR